jgi:solute carrier family 25 citrate transporter 1
MPNSEEQKNKITITQAMLSGSVAGACRIAINNPFAVLIQQFQHHEKLTLNPMRLYRGSLLNLCSMIPISSVQVGLNRLVQKYILQDPETLTHPQRIGVAIAAGIGAAPLSNVSSLIMTQQNNTPSELKRFDQNQQNKTHLQTTLHLYEKGGLKYFSNGLFATALRDGVFTGSALGTGPLLKQELQKQGVNEVTATIVSGVAAGSVATIATQGFDEIKTTQQLQKPQETQSFGHTAKNIYANHGIYGFVNGILPRGIRMITSIMIIGKVKEGMEEFFQEKNARTNKSSRVNKC